jgi:hypothetical protein
MSSSNVDFNDDKTRQIIEDYKTGLIKIKDVRAYVGRKLQAAGHTRQQTITTAPEGYYYPDASKISEHNRKVVQYNRELNNYRQELINSIVEYKKTPTGYAPTGPSGVPGYSRIEAAAIGSHTESDREYPGQPEAPPETPPGPGAGPAPGSIGEKISSKTTPAALGVLETIEKPFQAISHALRKRGEEYKAKSLTEHGENYLEGFGYYVAGTGFNVAASGFDVATFEIRPQLWVDLSKTAGGIAFSPEVRGQVWQQIKADPTGFTAEVVGGAALGGYARGKAVDIAKLGVKEADHALKVLKAQRGSTTEGLYGVSTKQPSYGQFWSEYRASKQVNNLLEPVADANIQYHEQLSEEWGGGQFPAETEEILTTRLFERRAIDVKTGTPTPAHPFFEDKAYYYSPVEPIPQGAERAYVEAFGDEWSPNLVSSQGETAIPYNLGDEGGFIKVEGYRRGGMKPFKEPNIPLEPRNDPVSSSVTKGSPDTPASILIQKGSNAFIEPKYYEFPSVTVTPRTINPVNVHTGGNVKSPVFKFKPITVPIIDVNLSQKPKTGTVSIEKTWTPNLEKQVQDTFNKSLNIPKPNLGSITIPGVTQIPRNTLKQTPEYVFKEVQIFDQDLGLIQLPEFDEKLDVPNWLTIPPGDKTNKRRYPGKEILKKTTRKKKRGKKGVFELRTDFAFNFKEPKIKEIKI